MSRRWAVSPLPPAPTSREEAWQRVARQIDADAAPPPPPDRAVAPSPAALTPRQRILSYVVAASVLVALGGGALWLRLGMPTTRPAGRLAVYALLDLTERLEELQKLEQRLAEEEMRLRSLKPVQSIRGARAYILWDVPARQWHFFALGLQPAPAGQTYQLWAAAENAPPAPGPTFEVDAEGSDAVVADFPDLPPETPVRALVTLEPLGGSAAPTGPTVLEAAL
ncbi:MAG TPA: anti-sigma factor [Lacipirellulaceae bacterium]|nr:anti-sigma factor [Lacipirellulaceae bacterium]